MRWGAHSPGSQSSAESPGSERSTAGPQGPHSNGEITVQDTQWEQRGLHPALRGGVIARVARMGMCQVLWGFPGGSAAKEAPCNAGSSGSVPGSGRSTGEGTVYPLQCSGEVHCQRRLGGYSPWSRKESDTTETFTHRGAVGVHKVALHGPGSKWGDVLEKESHPFKIGKSAGG